MHKIYNPGFFGLCPIDHFNCNSMSSLKFKKQLLCRYVDETSSILEALCDDI